MPTRKNLDNDEIIAAYLKKIQSEKEQVENILTQIEALEIEKRSRQLRVLGSNDTSNDSRLATQNQINTWKNRLNDALVKFNTKVQENKSLRDLISEKRRDRCLYDEIFFKRELELHDLSQQIRRETENKKTTDDLLNQTETSLAVAKKELEERTDALESDRKEMLSLREELKKENGKEHSQSQHQRRPKTTPNTAASAALSTEEEDQCNDDDIQDDLDVKKLDELLDHVKQTTGCDNIETLLDHMSGTEERNLSRFQYIAELEAELERVESDINVKAKKLQRMKNRGRSHKLQLLNERELAEKKQQLIIDNARALDKQYESQLELWEKMRMRIFEVHKEMRLPVPDALLGSDGVSESNVFAYLAEIEKKTTEIISAISSDYEDDDGTTSPSPVRASASKAILNFHLPSVKDAPADDGDRPFTFDELKSSLQMIAK